MAILNRISFGSRLAATRAVHVKMGRAALEGAALAVRNQAKRNVRGGFKSGLFVTGRLFNDISHVLTGSGDKMEAQVGTVIDYGAFWELGHHNAYTRKYERVQWLKPAFASTTDIQAKFAGQLTDNVAASGPGRDPPTGRFIGG